MTYILYFSYFLSTLLTLFIVAGVLLKSPRTYTTRMFTYGGFLLALLPPMFFLLRSIGETDLQNILSAVLPPLLLVGTSLLIALSFSDRIVSTKRPAVFFWNIQMFAVLGILLLIALVVVWMNDDRKLFDHLSLITSYYWLILHLFFYITVAIWCIRTLHESSGVLRDSIMVFAGTGMLIITTLCAEHLFLVFPAQFFNIIETSIMFILVALYGTLARNITQTQPTSPITIYVTVSGVVLCGIIGVIFTLVHTRAGQVLVTLAFLLAIGMSIALLMQTRFDLATTRKGEQLARYLANANARLRELDKQKTEFVSLASHQLRAPIAAIKGYTSMIIDGSYGDVPKILQEPLMRTLESGNRLAIMIDDFLNVTRIEQGRMSYASQPVVLNKMLRDVANEVQITAKNKGLDLRVQVPEGNSVIVTGDEGKLRQVCSNVLDNAIKYTKDGFVSITLKITQKHKSVIIEIADSGVGVAPEEQSRLFTKFTRASNANDATVYGTGLGLYIAKEIVKAHNGWIHVSSPGIGKGTAFTIELPLATAPVTASDTKGAEVE